MRAIVNRKAKFEYQFLQTFEAGIVLSGPEVKSLRLGNANLSDAFCYFRNHELYMRNMHIAEYNMATDQVQDTKRERKLLLKKAELRKLERKTKEKGLSIVPFKIFFNDRGFVKVMIALGQGKKSYDKRETIKERDTKRDLQRIKKIRL